MNLARRRLALQLERLARIPDQQFAQGYLALVAGLERDFRDEEAIIEALGHHALHNHREQQARALAALHQVENRVADGDTALGRKVIALLDQWLQLHYSATDMALVCVLASRARHAQELSRGHG